MPTSSQIAELIRGIDSLLVVLADYQKDVQRAWKGSVGAIFVGITALVLGLLSYVSITEIQDLRAETQVALCLQHNELLERQRSVLSSSIITLADDPTDLTPREEGILREYTQVVNQSLPDRNCSPEGIANYLNRS